MERIAVDSVFIGIKIIAKLGIPPDYTRWAVDLLHWQGWMEWSRKFRDEVCHFIKGSGREPHHNVTFVSFKDGFLLFDLVMYNQKHNLAISEKNRDG